MTDQVNRGTAGDWEVRYGFDPIGLLGYVSSVDEFKTEKEAEARIKELWDKKIVPPGERIELKYIGSGCDVSKGSRVYMRAVKISTQK
tara:strand:- start:804 stop:1067 length:264 start_codon:yes stop_codon:yes gene_type:complete